MRTNVKNLAIIKRSFIIPTKNLAIELLAILLILAGTFSACKEKEKDVRKAYSAKEGNFYINENEFAMMYLYPENGFINLPVELIIENHTNGVLTFDTEFSLEYWDKDNWTKIRLDIPFENIGLGLLVGETYKKTFESLSFEEHNNEKKGKYRIIKKFQLSYNFPAEIDNSFYLYTEFEIK